MLFVLLALGVIAPYELIVVAATGDTSFGAQTDTVSTALTVSLIDFVLIGPLVSALYIHAVKSIGAGERPVAREVLTRGLRVLPTVAAAQIIATLGIALGFVAFVVPGVILLLRWAVVAQAAAVENENWIEALRRSGELAAGNYLHILGLLLLTGLIATLVLDLGLEITGTHTGAGDVVLGIVFETLARSFVALTTAVLFFDLLARRGPIQ